MWIVTFYSFKGGVGRTMALVNCAAELAKRGRRVLIVDFDLEAPGIHTYRPFHGAQEHAGIVDYVTQYITTRKAPDVREFIFEGEFNGSSLSCMSAGVLDSNYAWKLNSIDWRRLYEEYQGYILFEDMKRQWEKHGFDYVLIDSRTGHTDVGGICTRQLPNAAVMLFFPNDQNVNGLKQVTADIRSEAKGPSRKDIKLHFCPSNVPDLDDEEQILERHLSYAELELGYSEPASIIRHYRSLSLLDQLIFVTERPNSRLTKEYQLLVDSIVSENIEDRAGAVARLRRIRSSLVSDKSPKNIELVNRIVDLHPRDGEVSFVAANIYNHIGLEDAELEMLSRAISSGFQEAFARSRRASILMSRSQDDVAREDLQAVLESKRARPWEIGTAIERLREIDPNWLDTAKRSPALRQLDLTGLVDVVNPLMYDRRGADLAVELMAKFEPFDDDEGIVESFVLALISTGRFDDAMKLVAATREEILVSSQVSDVFNFAAAEWGSQGVPSADVFQRVIDLYNPEVLRSPNNWQCLALSNYVVGNKEEAQTILNEAKESVDTVSRIFSCWRYLYTSRKEFLKDIDEMEKSFKRNRIVPSFVKAFSKPGGLNRPM